MRNLTQMYHHYDPNTKERPNQETVELDALERDDALISRQAPLECEKEKASHLIRTLAGRRLCRLVSAHCLNATTLLYDRLHTSKSSFSVLIPRAYNLPCCDNAARCLNDHIMRNKT